MLIEFEERIALPVEQVYPYFKSPLDWPRLYGSFGAVQDLGDGWYAVPLRRFPFPLIARVTDSEPNKRVSWSLGGFWRGEGRICFEPCDSGTLLRGHERIAVAPAGPLSPLVERLLLEKRFRKVWETGWRRLRRLAESGPVPA